MFPARMDDFVDGAHPLRAFDAYVEHLDLKKLGYRHTQANEENRGQPAYPPGALLKLYLYGYLNRIASSRRLARECERNLEVMWLLEGLRPCYKTISDFRSRNRDAIRATHREFILFCNALSLFGGSCIAVDGSFFKGNASRKSFKTVARMKEKLAEVEAHIRCWERALDDEESAATALGDEAEKEDLPEKLKAWEDRKRDIEQTLKAWEEQGKTQESRTDPDARLLNKGSQKVAGYNVQIAVDDRHHLIVADAVTSDPNDLRQLHPLSVQAKAVLGVAALDVLADGGYYSAAQLVACLDEGLVPYVPEPSPKSKRPESRYTADTFEYEAKRDCYRCPAAGHELKRSGQPRTQNGQRIQRYAASGTVCQSCPLRDNCIRRTSRCRELWRSEHETLLHAHRTRMQANPEKVRLRGALVEHPFGTLKTRSGWSHFLLRGREKVLAEWSLMVLSYNFTRVLNILGIARFIEAVKTTLQIRFWKRLYKTRLEEIVRRVQLIRFAPKSIETTHLAYVGSP
jgi:transposase